MNILYSIDPSEYLQKKHAAAGNRQINVVQQMVKLLCINLFILKIKKNEMKFVYKTTGMKTTEIKYGWKQQKKITHTVNCIGTFSFLREIFADFINIPLIRQKQPLAKNAIWSI